MKWIILLAGVLSISLAPSVGASEIPPGATLVKTIRWQAEKLPPEAKWHAGGPAGAGFVTVSNPESKPASIELWASEQLGIQTKWYALRGKIRYRGVAGVGYLDLWSSFTGDVAGQKARYFSRTLANRGPLAQITGNADWRDAFLPFDGDQAKAPPVAIELNLVLPGAGAVEISDLQILQFADAAALWATVGSSPGDQPAASVMKWIFDAILGSIVLAAGAVVAVIVFLIKRRKRNEMRRMRALDLA